jgi:hypothetical protein
VRRQWQPSAKAGSGNEARPVPAEQLACVMARFENEQMDGHRPCGQFDLAQCRAAKRRF